MSCGALPPPGSDLPESLRTEQPMRPPLPAGTPIWLRHDPYWQPPSMFIAVLLEPVGRWVRADAARQPKGAEAVERVRRGRVFGGDDRRNATGGLGMTWMEDDIATLRDEYAEGKIGLGELEDGLDDVFGVNGGIGHARECLITQPSGACTCPKAKPECPRSHRPWRAWIRGREYCYSCAEWEPRVAARQPKGETHG